MNKLFNKDMLITINDNFLNGFTKFVLCLIRTVGDIL